MGDNVVLKQQYLDFMHGRTFRQSLLCHQEVALERDSSASRLGSMYVAAPAREVAEEGGVKKFEGLRETFAETDQPAMQDAFRILGEQWPSFVSVKDMLVGTTVDPDTFAEALLQLYQINFLEVYLDNPHFVTHVSKCPVASPVARFQIQTSPYLSTLSFGSIRISDPITSLLLPLLDGRHTHDDLLKAMLALVDEGVLVPKQNDAAVSDRKLATELLEQSLNTALTKMALQGLLLA
jgi:methyltransferase-like protein